MIVAISEDEDVGRRVKVKSMCVVPEQELRAFEKRKKRALAEQSVDKRRRREIFGVQHISSKHELGEVSPGD